MTDERSQEELAGGFLRVVLGGSPKQLPTLKIRAERDWKLFLAERIGEQEFVIDFEALKKGGLDAYAALAPVANMPTDIAVDLLVAYDKSGALGGKDWIEENADASEVYRALVKALKVAFPFVTDLRGLLVEANNLRQLVDIARSGRSNSTNGRAPTGDLTPTLLNEPSTPSS